MKTWNGQHGLDYDYLIPLPPSCQFDILNQLSWKSGGCTFRWQAVGNLSVLNASIGVTLVSFQMDSNSRLSTCWISWKNMYIMNSHLVGLGRSKVQNLWPSLACLFRLVSRNTLLCFGVMYIVYCPPVSLSALVCVISPGLFKSVVTEIRWRSVSRLSWSSLAAVFWAVSRTVDSRCVFSFGAIYAVWQVTKWARFSGIYEM